MPIHGLEPELVLHVIWKIESYLEWHLHLYQPDSNMESHTLLSFPYHSWNGLIRPSLIRLRELSEIGQEMAFPIPFHIRPSEYFFQTIFLEFFSFHRFHILHSTHFNNSYNCLNSVVISGINTMVSFRIYSPFSSLFSTHLVHQ